MHRSLGNYQAAIRDYNQAIALQPEYPGAFNNRGYAKQLTEDYCGAAEDYQRAIAIDGSYELAQNNLADIQEKLTNCSGTASAYLAPPPMPANVPTAQALRSQALAVIISNQIYRSVSDVEFARRDADSVRHYFITKLGIPADRIIMKRNLTLSDMRTFFGSENDAEGVLYRMTKGTRAKEVFVFYAGHGAPGVKTKQEYLMPVDCQPTAVHLNGYALPTLYANLRKLPTTAVNVLLEACFSGREVVQDVSFIGAAVRHTQLSRPGNNEAKLTVLSATGEGQYAHWNTDRKQGMFTHFLLRALHNPRMADANQDRQLTWEELHNFLGGKVYLSVYQRYKREQSPGLQGDEPQRVFFAY